MKSIVLAASALSATLCTCNSSLHHQPYYNNPLTLNQMIKSIRGGETLDEVESILEDPKQKEQLSKDKSIPGVDMPTLFNLNIPEERMYDRYAACLAATEGLQRYRDYEMSNRNKRKQRVFFSLSNNEQNTEKSANARYILNSSKVIRALGLSIPLFSRLGREIENDPILKNRVKEQAYLYRMASTVTMPRKSILIHADNKVTKPKPTTASATPKEKPTVSNAMVPNKYQTFAKTLKEMEYTRQEQIDRLCRAMNIDSLPANIYNDQVIKVLHPKVRAVYEAFPHQAEEIIRQNGFKVDDFNLMLKKMKSNPIVKWKVDQCLKRELN